LHWWLLLLLLFFLLLLLLLLQKMVLTLCTSISPFQQSRLPQHILPLLPLHGAQNPFTIPTTTPTATA
jgi:hypothetical protein